jgi:hypothetical protein
MSPRGVWRAFRASSRGRSLARAPKHPCVATYGIGASRPTLSTSSRTLRDPPDAHHDQAREGMELLERRSDRRTRSAAPLHGSVPPAILTPGEAQAELARKGHAPRERASDLRPAQRLGSRSCRGPLWWSLNSNRARGPDCRVRSKAAVLARSISHVEAAALVRNSTLCTRDLTLSVSLKIMCDDTDR